MARLMCVWDTPLVVWGSCADFLTHGQERRNAPHTGRVRRPTGIGMAWWLALVFAGIAALTAVVVAQVFYARTETSIRERAGELSWNRRGGGDEGGPGGLPRRHPRGGVRV